jgi:hypothetical protein
LRRRPATEFVHVLATATVAGTTTTVIDSSLAELIASAGAGPVFTVARCEGDEMELRNPIEGGFSQTLTLARQD